MRRLVHVIVLTSLVSSILTASAAAQSPVAGSLAAGGNLGVFFPDEALEKTFTIDGFGEYYVVPNISVRGMLAWASPGFENFTENHFRQVKLLFNGMYYWKRENWLPFATVGAGAYFVREYLENEPDPDSETRGGINFGFGTEYLLGGGGSVKTELRWDLVSHPPDLTDATGFSLTFGYKRYF